MRRAQSSSTRDRLLHLEQPAWRPTAGLQRAEGLLQDYHQRQGESAPYSLSAQLLISL
jgi:hypothetical protein